jgi:hypothetical protein
LIKIKINKNDIFYDVDCLDIMSRDAGRGGYYGFSKKVSLLIRK